MCHLRHHEGQALERVQRLVGRPVGDSTRRRTLADLKAQLSWAQERGAATHLDGARLWESAAGYERSPADVVADFDTVYVSFYKGIGSSTHARSPPPCARCRALSSYPSRRRRR